jgi:hypothetical protein
MLIKPFSELEIKEALFQIEKTKASGPDKIPMSSTECAGILSKVISFSFLMSFMMTKWMFVELTMAS